MNRNEILRYWIEKKHTSFFDNMLYHLDKINEINFAYTIHQIIDTYKDPMLSNKDNFLTPIYGNLYLYIIMNFEISEITEQLFLSFQKDNRITDKITEISNIKFYDLVNFSKKINNIDLLKYSSLLITQQYINSKIHDKNLILNKQEFMFYLEQITSPLMSKTLTLFSIEEILKQAIKNYEELTEDFN